MNFKDDFLWHFWLQYVFGFNLQVTSPGGAIVHALKGTSGEKFEFKAPQSGTYKFCFNNPVATPETVSFYIHVGHIPNEYDLAKDGQFNSNFYPSLSLPLSLSLSMYAYILQNIWTLWMWGSPSWGRPCCLSRPSKSIWKPGMLGTVLVSCLKLHSIL